MIDKKHFLNHWEKAFMFSKLEINPWSSVTPSFNINQCWTEYECERTSSFCDPNNDPDCGVIGWKNVGQTIEVIMVLR